MQNINNINEHIARLTMPLKDIYTTVYTVKTDSGDLLFDTATYDTDVSDAVLPFLDTLSVTTDTLKYVFISHNHSDHAGGLKALIKRFPDVTIISRCPKLKEQYKEYNILVPEENDVILDCLKIVTIPGHTQDSCAIYDTRTKTLICGDCLQLYGIYGSGKWGSNISFPKAHIEAVKKLHNMDIEHILTAHDYQPYGYRYDGKEAVKKALDACISPLMEIKNMILDNPHWDDEKIAKHYNSFDCPTLGAHVVTAVRKELL